MTPSPTQQAVAEWRSHQPDLIHCEQRKGLWTIRACKARQAGRLNFKVVGNHDDIIEDASAVAPWFDACVGCEHFTPEELHRKVKPCERFSTTVFVKKRGVRKRLTESHAARRSADAADPTRTDMFSEDHGRGVARPEPR